MSTQALANVWHTLALELGRDVTRQILLENAPTAPPIMRRMDIVRRTVTARCA